jgi:serine/threonine protein kinase
MPARLGRYRVTAKLGAGGFGVVCRGYDDDLKRDVAIKVPHRRRVQSAADAEAYLAEAQALAGSPLQPGPLV